MSIIKLGCVIPSIKKKSLNMDTMFNFEANDEISIKLLPIDPSIPLEKQVKCDLIIHKINDYVVEELGIREREAACLFIQNFSQNCKINNVRLLDPWETVNFLSYRMNVHSLVKKCEFEMNGVSVRSPSTVEIEKSMSDVEMLKLMKDEDLNFPFIIKPLGGLLPEFRYEMSLHFSANVDGYSKITDQFKNYLPCAAQQFYNHDGILYKLYVIGKRWHVTPRPSVENCSFDRKEPLYFKSCDISRTKVLVKSTIKEIKTEDPCSGLDSQVIDEVLKRIRSHLNFSLIGLDIIVVGDPKIYYIVDVNYFPGYKAVPQVKNMFFDLFAAK